MGAVRRFVRDDLRPVVVPWIVARLLVVAALGLARHVYGRIGSGVRPESLVHGLWAWDGWHYRELAQLGYSRAPYGDARFFPLHPLLGRVVGVTTGGAPIGLLVVSSVSALVFAVLLRRLVLLETGDRVLADRSVWLGALLPWMFVLVLGYSEALFLALTAGVFLAARNRRWPVAAVLALLVGLSRPYGIVLAAPLAWEAWRAWPTGTGRSRTWSVLAVVAPAVGLAVFLAYCAHLFGDWLEPFHIQQTTGLRGGTSDPLRSLWRSFEALRGREHVGAGLHVLWAPVIAAFVWAAARRLPGSYTLWAILVCVLALSADNISSFERYSVSAFPVIVGAAAISEYVPEDVWRGGLVLSAAGMFGLSLVVFLGTYVP